MSKLPCGMAAEIESPDYPGYVQFPIDLFTFLYFNCNIIPNFIINSLTGFWGFGVLGFWGPWLD